MHYCYFDSPIGKLLLAGKVSNDQKTKLCLLSFPAGKMATKPLSSWKHSPQYFSECIQQLTEYFAGTRKSFSLPFELQGTSFQQQVLTCVADVKYGTTASYSDIATSIGNPKAVRAVGMANARNNLPIIIPCHRVIGKNGNLTGFGGGLETKTYLLNLEANSIV